MELLSIAIGGLYSVIHAFRNGLGALVLAAIICIFGIQSFLGDDIITDRLNEIGTLQWGIKRAEKNGYETCNV